MANEPHADTLAIVGISCRLPGAPDFAALGRLLKEGREGITRLSRQEQERAGISAAMLDNPRMVSAAAMLEDIEGFDVGAFNCSVTEATFIDPQHRLMLELAREALDDAGYPRAGFAGQIGVYAGVESSQYFIRHLLPQLDEPFDLRWHQQLILNDKDALASQIAFRLGLSGPALVVQGGCSTGLLALHVASQSLLNGECELALVGAAALRLPQRSGYLFQPGGLFSADGHTRSFDARGSGTVYGSGGAMLALRRYEDALRDGDHVLALICGSATYNHGAARPSFTTPTPQGHAIAIAEALAVSGLLPEQIHYLEANGTATPLGDAIELEGISQVFRNHPLHVGSVRSNIGHVQAAAGLAGLLKVVWALQEGAIPATLHFTEPNSVLKQGRLTVNSVLAPWPSSLGPRRAGVSTFAIGGVHCHVVLEQAPGMQRRANRPVRVWNRTRCWPDELPRTARVIAPPRMRHEPVIDKLAAFLPAQAMRIDAQTPISELGLSSLELLVLLADLERAYPKLTAALLTTSLKDLRLDTLAALIDAASEPSSTIAQQQQRVVQPQDDAPGWGDLDVEVCILGSLGSRMEIAFCGQGPPLLLLPPLGTSARIWRPIVRALRSDFYLIMPELPGFGRSDSFRHGEDEQAPIDSPESQTARRILQLLDERGLTGQMHVVGWSYGGCLALQIALDHPSRVVGLGLACSTACALKLPRFAELHQLLGRLTSSITEELASASESDADAQLVRALLAPNSETAKAAFAQAQALMQFDVLGRLQDVRAPVLLLSGRRDRVLLPEHAAALSSRLHVSQERIVEDAGHLLPATHPTIFAASVRDFFGQLSISSSRPEAN